MFEKRGYSWARHGQITIFVILALVIVVIVVLFFIFRGQLIGDMFSQSSPLETIRSCISNHVDEGIVLVSAQGGMIIPRNYYLYQGNMIEYVCYTRENYQPCVMQKPLFKESVERELERYLTPLASECLSDIKENLERSGYQVSYQQPIVNVSLVSHRVITSVAADIVVTKAQTESYQKVLVDSVSSLYTFVTIAHAISNSEARYGDSEPLQFMLYHPSLRVEKLKQSDGTTVYVLKERNTREEFLFATRSGAVPPGVTGQ